MQYIVLIPHYSQLCLVRQLMYSDCLKCSQCLLRNIAAGNIIDKQGVASNIAGVSTKFIEFQLILNNN